MEITALITAYDRIQFLPLALESVGRQNLSPERFEILVLSNREEHRSLIARFRVQYPRLQLRFELTGRSSIGEMLDAGFELARGRIVCLLNDDDEWAPNKLSRVSATFSAHPRLSYFHNGSSVIRGHRAGFTTAKEVGPRLGLAHPAERLVAGSRLEELRSVLRWTPMDFNDSCISVAREVALRHSLALRSISTNEDTFLFYLAALSAGELAESCEPLTQYRVHGNAMTQASRVGGEVAWQKLAANDAATVASLDTLRELAKAEGRSDLLPLIDHDREYSRLVAATRNGSESRAEVARQLVRFLPFWAYARVPSGLRAMAWAALSIINRRAGRTGYLTLRQVGNG